jgi:N4-gp56 family major capsid protein
MADLGTNLGIKFANEVVKRMYELSVFPVLTNQEYEGTLSAGGADRVRILTLGEVTLTSYTEGTDMNIQTPTESQAELTLSQKKYYNFKIPSLVEFEMYVNNPQSSLIQNAAEQLAITIDTYVLGLYSDVGAGNWVGTDYTTGTVEVTVTTGAVAGSGTTFTSAMVGRPFKATGHTSWYRVKTYTNGTTIVIEDDLDDTTSAYTGGAISAGATYTVQATTAITLSTSNTYTTIVSMAQKLDAAKAPKENRVLVVNSYVASWIKKDASFIPAVSPAYNDVVLQGQVGMISGFKVVQNENVAGDATTGYYIIGAHKSWMTFAHAFKESRVIDVDLQFAKMYQGLNVYGAKVIDVNRKNACLAFVK